VDHRWLAATRKRAGKAALMYATALTCLRLGKGARWDNGRSLTSLSPSRSGRLLAAPQSPAPVCALRSHWRPDDRAGGRRPGQRDRGGRARGYSSRGFAGLTLASLAVARSRGVVGRAR
jgi:hypothetical protein